jgi:3-hydroxyisobutyrate dehydrogenase-like beta-hydroxyacid dehydrogenase
MEITYKDVELQAALAKSLGMPMFMASMALRVYEMGKAMGLGDKDACRSFPACEH